METRCSISITQEVFHNVPLSYYGIAGKIIHTPGHTADSISVLAGDRLFTGDTLLIGGCGRTDLPTGDPDQLYDSLFNRLLRLDPATRVYPAHIYSDREFSTIGEELAENPRLKHTSREGFVEQMRTLTLRDPDHLSEALRTNLSGGKTVEQLIAEAAHNVTLTGRDASPSSATAPTLLNSKAAMRSAA